MQDIFISYSRKNRDAVLPIKDEIERTLGLRCWMDLSDIPCGEENFKKTVISGIKQTSIAFLFFLSAESQGSEYAMKEINFAKKIAKKRVILVRFNDDKMTDEFAFDYQDADVIDWRGAEQKGKLLRDLKNWANNGVRSADTPPTKMFSEGTGQPSQSDGDRDGCNHPIVVDDVGQSTDRGTRIFVQPSEEVRTCLKKLKPTEREASSGFRVVEIGDETILLSDAVNNALLKMGADAMHVDVLAESGNPYSKSLEREYAIASRVLEWKKTQSRGNFRNESKIGLATDIVLDENGNLPAVVSVFKTDYFASYRTNEMPTMDVFEEGEYGVSRIWAGYEHFPVMVDRNGEHGMTPFFDPGFSNHLGGNTLGVTDDGHLVLWLQSNKAERSRNRWAPTGSGSLDWSDLDLNGSFLRTIRNGAARELREECRIVNDDISIETKVIGFYRWCSRGGLPGFLCVSRIRCEVSRLSPDTSEVNTIVGNPMIGIRPARNKGRLMGTVQEILDGSTNLHCPLSTPLVANLMAVRTALSSGSEELDFLFQ